MTATILDPEILEFAALVMFKRWTYADGTLELPCRLDLLDEAMVLIQDLMQALQHNPPQEALDQWRHLLAEKIEESNQLQGSQRLVFRYEPYDPLEGLTGGFQFRISLKLAEPMQYRQLDLQTADARELCRHMTLAEGRILFPCVPALLSQIIQMMGDNLAALGQLLSESDVEAYHRLLGPKFIQWFDHHPNTRLSFRYSPLDSSLGVLGGFNIELSSQLGTIESSYNRWAELRKGSLFGEIGNAKVVQVAEQVSQGRDPSTIRILDVGAGTGRNTLPLGQAGFQVEALELTEVLTQTLIERSQAEGLLIQTITGDLLDRDLPLEDQSYDFVFLAEVLSAHFRSLDQVRQALVRSCELLKEEGQLLFDIFLCVPDYEPTVLIRQLAQVYWTYFITESELQELIQDLPLELISHESVYDFEEEHTPPEHWPPTIWFESWATGRNLFPIYSARPPLELKWLQFRRSCSE